MESHAAPGNQLNSIFFLKILFFYIDILYFFQYNKIYRLNDLAELDELTKDGLRRVFGMRHRI